MDGFTLYAAKMIGYSQEDVRVFIIGFVAAITKKEAWEKAVNLFSPYTLERLELSEIPVDALIHQATQGGMSYFEMYDAGVEGWIIQEN